MARVHREIQIQRAFAHGGGNRRPDREIQAGFRNRRRAGFFYHHKMTVSEAVRSRRSVRAFLDTPVPAALIAEILTKASRAPSGGNVQPWKIYVLSGEALARFKAIAALRVAESPEGEMLPEYSI